MQCKCGHATIHYSSVKLAKNLQGTALLYLKTRVCQIFSLKTAIDKIFHPNNSKITKSCNTSLLVKSLGKLMY